MGVQPRRVFSPPQHKRRHAFPSSAQLGIRQTIMGFRFAFGKAEALIRSPKREGDLMKSECNSVSQRSLAGASPFLAIVVAFTCLGLASGMAVAQHSQTAVKEFEDFDSKNFDRSTHIDNEWFPLKPGTRWVYEGFTFEDGKRLPHRVVFTVTDLTKVIGGVRAIVAWDQDYSAGKLEESEILFFAQDKDGNVWYLGEYPEVYEGGKLVATPVWIHGIQEAKAGIIMKAEPRLGTPSYSEGWAPSVPWTDRGVVYQMGQKTCVPWKCYEDVLV